MKKKDIEQAAADAVKVIAAAASEAAHTVANAAAEAVKVSNVKGANDHDLLVVLNTKMEDLKVDIQDLKDGTSARITALETSRVTIFDFLEYKKAVDKSLDDHEKRMKISEKANTTTNVMLGIGIAILGLLVSLMVTHILGK